MLCNSDKAAILNFYTVSTERSCEFHTKTGKVNEKETVIVEHSLGDFIWYQSSYNSNQSESNLRHLNFDPYPSRTRGGP